MLFLKLKLLLPVYAAGSGGRTKAAAGETISAVLLFSLKISHQPGTADKSALRLHQAPGFQSSGKASRYLPASPPGPLPIPPEIFHSPPCA